MEDLNPPGEGNWRPDGRNGAGIRGDDASQGSGPSRDDDGSPRLDRQSTDLIGRRLREYYVALAHEPLPARIASLLERLDKPASED
jgi:hypothetical protein